MDPLVHDAEFLRKDLRSESTLPLLNFFLQLNRDSTTEEVNDKLHKLTASVGVEKRPLPDESEQLQKELLQLMQGVPKVTDSPTV